MKILGTGLSGLVGSRIVELLKNKFEFESSDVDITDEDKILDRIKNSDASVILHLAAKTNVDSCQVDKEKGKEGEAWKVNVLGTKNVVDACLLSNKKIIYISTDFVFDGEKQLGSSYTEEDIPNPINWYGATKYEGEKIVQAASSDWLIARIAYPYRARFKRNDFVRTILSRLQNNEKIEAVFDHIFTPTFIDDLAGAISTLIKSNSTGIYHIVGSGQLSPFDASVLIAKTFNLTSSLIIKTTRAEYFKSKAPRPFNLALSNGKIKKLGVGIKTFEEGLENLKIQLNL